MLPAPALHQSGAEKEASGQSKEQKTHLDVDHLRVDMVKWKRFGPTYCLTAYSKIRMKRSPVFLGGEGGGVFLTGFERFTGFFVHPVLQYVPHRLA